MKFTVDIDIDQRIIDAHQYRSVEDALAVAVEHMLSCALTKHAGKGDVTSLDGLKLGTWAVAERGGKLTIQGAEGQAREFVITSPFTSSGRYMEFTATAADADVDYRMLIERVS